MDADAAGNTVVYMVPNYQIDGKTGTWLPYDSEVVEGVCFFMMRNSALCRIPAHVHMFRSSGISHARSVRSYPAASFQHDGHIL